MNENPSDSIDNDLNLVNADGNLQDTQNYQKTSIFQNNVLNKTYSGASPHISEISTARKGISKTSIINCKLVSETSRAIMDKKTFLAFIRGTKPSHRSRTSQMIHNRDMSFTDSTVSSFSESFAKGKIPEVSDPNVLSSVIEDLNIKKIAAMDAKDYLECSRLDRAIKNARQQYRTSDRTIRYETTVRDIEGDLQQAESTLKSAKDEWKEKRVSLERKHEEDRQRMRSKHIEQQNDFSNYWNDSNNHRYFTKRSSGHLQSLSIERSLALTGRFTEADKQRKINERNEKNAVKEQCNNLKVRVDEERSKLVAVQKDDNEQLMLQQDLELKILAENEKKDLDVKKKACDKIQRHLNEEKVFGNFCAHCYKRNPSVLLPPAAIGKNEDDIPALPLNRTYPRGVDEMIRIKAKSQSANLNLPVLRFRKFKVPEIGKKKKEKHED